MSFPSHSSPGGVIELMCWVASRQWNSRMSDVAMVLRVIFAGILFNISSSLLLVILRSLLIHSWLFTNICIFSFFPSPPPSKNAHHSSSSVINVTHYRLLQLSSKCMLNKAWGGKLKEKKKDSFSSLHKSLDEFKSDSRRKFSILYSWLCYFIIFTIRWIKGYPFIHVLLLMITYIQFQKMFLHSEFFSYWWNEVKEIPPSPRHPEFSWFIITTCSCCKMSSYFIKFNGFQFYICTDI